MKRNKQETNGRQRRCLPGKRIIFIGIAIFTVLLNVFAWNSTVFSNAYIAYIFPIWVNTYGRITGLFPFSVGEWMIAAGVILVLAAAVLAVAAVIVWLINRIRISFSLRSRLTRKDSCEKPWEESDKQHLRDNGGFGIYGYWKRFLKGFYEFFAWTLLIVSLVMTLNCFILYHASTFSQKYFGGHQREYSLEELLLVRNYVVEQCNGLSPQMERAQDNSIVFTGSVLKDGSVGDMGEKAIEIMQALGKTYPQLDGYYPKPKALLCSDFMCQQYTQGYYFPFSMEANYNDVMYVMNIPATLCHELAHLRGYIFEDEANFISYLACIESEDDFFRYSGYLSVLNYLENDLYHVWKANPEAYEKAAQAVPPVSVLPQVYEDNVFVVDAQWERINGKAIFDTEDVDRVSDAFTDMTLKVNGVSDGMVSYSRVVELLLQYYSDDTVMAMR